MTKTIKIDGIDYVPKSEIKPTVIKWDGKKSIANRAIGKKVIVRSRNEGINAGEVVLADETGIELKNCRRLWYHKPLDTSVSWYEGVAMTGISSDSKISDTVTTKIIIEDYSVIECTDEAYQTIFNLKSNVQS